MKKKNKNQPSDLNKTRNIFALNQLAVFPHFSSLHLLLNSKKTINNFFALLRSIYQVFTSG